MKNEIPEKDYLLCIRNDDCDDLILHKVYPVIHDKKAESEGFIRIVDESDEGYLYPQTFFSKVHLSKKALEAVSAC